MRILLLTVLLFSTALTAQRREKFKLSPKTDTTKIHHQEKPSESDTDKQQQKLYKILTLKPKDTSDYLALKQPKKDYSKYKIPNAFHPEKSEIETKTKPSK